MGIFLLYLHRKLTLMNIIFKEEALSELYTEGKTKDRKYAKLCRNKKLVEGYQRAVSLMYSTDRADSLKMYSFLHYEKLKYQDTPKSSVRIANGQIERLIFTENDNGIEVELIEIDSTHYGNKQ